MNRWNLLRVCLLGLAFALGTAVFGWWAVPALGAVWGVIAGVDERPAFAASLAAGIGWLLLLGWTATQGPLLELARRTAGVMGVPSVVLLAITVMFPMVIAWGGAAVGSSIRWFLISRRQ